MNPIIVATPGHVRDIVDVTNEAFMADSFFKKPEYHHRFNQEFVSKMLCATDSKFLLSLDGTKVIGCLYLHWSKESITDNEIKITGKFRAVSVLDSYTKRGIGKSLVRAAEEHILGLATALSMEKNFIVTSIMEMSVINQRKDLFAWYGKQGYEIISEIRPNEPDFAAMLLDNIDICLVLMRKNL